MNTEPLDIRHALAGHARRLPWARAMCLALAFPATVLAADPNLNSWTSSPDPYASAGHCRNQSSAVVSKWWLVGAVGDSGADVLALQVLDCRPFSGSGVSTVACDPLAGGVPYAFCVRTRNDGAGNDMTLGVLKRSPATEPDSPYSGCPTGATPGNKLALVREAGVDPRRVKGVVTLACSAATATERTRARATPCPPEPHPYAGCISTPKDAAGNAVTLGLVRAQGPDDPHGLMGECDGSSAGVRAGFVVKADLLVQAGVSLASVRAADVTSCQVPWGMGGWLPDTPTRIACSEVPGFPAPLLARYDYCVAGIDAHNNGFVMGVSGR